MKTDKRASRTLGLILKGYPRISETFISNEILLLEELGFSLHIFSMRQPRETFTHAAIENIRARVTYLPETIIRSLPRLLQANMSLARLRPRSYARALRLMQRRYRRSRRTATIKHLLQAGLLVRENLLRGSVIHLHAHFAHSPTSVAMFAAILAGMPFSFTAHAKDIYTSDQRQLAEKISMARFVVTCTEYNRRYLQQLAPGSTPIYRVYHGIDPGAFPAGAKDAEPRPPYRVLTVARLVPKKGIPTILQALRLLRQQGLDLRYCLIGDGDERQALLKMIAELGLHSVTEWLGTQPHEVVRQRYRWADVFVLACRVAANGDRDGIPNVLLESMAMGVPVVATNVSAIPELVCHQETGLLVPPGRPELLAAALRQALEDSAFRARAIAAGRQRVAAEFDNRILIRTLAALFAEAGVWSQKGKAAVERP